MKKSPNYLFIVVLKFFAINIDHTLGSTEEINNDIYVLNEQKIDEISGKIDVVENRVRAVMPIMSSASETAIFVPISQCISLGYIFGMQNYTDVLNEDLISSVNHVYRGRAISQPDNPILDAREVVIWWQLILYMISDFEHMDVEVARARWDLNCAGKDFVSSFPPYQNISIAASSTIDERREAFATIDGNTITILGEITGGFYERLKQVVSDVPDPSSIIVSLGSGGGNVGEAVRAGRLLRKLEVTTELYDTCNSACPLVFLGGVKRHVWHPSPSIGFHMLSGAGRPIDSDSDLYDQIRNYVDEMGADGNTYVDFMLQAKPSEFFHPGILALCDARVVTWAQRQCVAEPL